MLGFPDVSEEARKAYRERFWYDSAGPVYPKQVKGLTEGMGIPLSQMVFGTVGLCHSPCYGVSLILCRITLMGLDSGMWMLTLGALQMLIFCLQRTRTAYLERMHGVFGKTEFRFDEC